MYTVPFKSTRRGRTVRFLAATVSSSLFLPPFLPLLLVSPLKPLGIVLIELLLHSIGSLSSLFLRKVLIRERRVASIDNKKYPDSGEMKSRERERDPHLADQKSPWRWQPKWNRFLAYTKLGPCFDHGPLNQCLFPHYQAQRKDATSPCSIISAFRLWPADYLQYICT